jgi:hypothetical protein
MEPSEYTTRWHSFWGDVRPDARVCLVSGNPVVIEHVCAKNTKAFIERSGLGAKFFGPEFALPQGVVRVELEKPISAVPRCGYCKYCNVLWVANE